MAAKNTGAKYETTYGDFIKSHLKTIPPALLLFTTEKIIFNEILSIIADKFIGSSFVKEKDLKIFYSDDCEAEEVINECSNLSFFSEKKLVVYIVVKKTGVRGIIKNVKSAFLDYIKRPNPDTVLLVYNRENEFKSSGFGEFEDSGFKISVITAPEQNDIFVWAKEKFSDYRIDDDTINHFLQFLNPSYDEIFSEIEKLKTFCYETKEIGKDAVNLCVGMSKDFNETDLIEAVLMNDREKALRIYNNMTLKDDIEIYLVYLLGNAYIGAAKMKDPDFDKIPNDFLKKNELRIWGKDSSKLFTLYKKLGTGINELKFKEAFDYIYSSDKSLKTSQDKRTVINNLITNLINLNN